ncbi:uncharacterized protein LOC132039329 [Lycium ferocissimum]|uniref:uncharacterized protein LOC132039329 n=1 Tax=Lycium ferocissimum TaxID=112874 RepID=UPI002815F97C|nr:uncharacterized protein LOC132039329 [Lycium ferocissimum]
MKVRRSNFKYAPYNWNELVQVLQAYTHKYKVTQVLWKFPEMGWIKCNTDGASRGNPGRSSWGFCVRNNTGDIIHAQAEEIEGAYSTNTQAEVMAILQALRFIKHTQRDQVLIETDSLLLVKVIHKIWEVPWQIVNEMEEIWEIMATRSISVNHILREGNKMADYLANLALDNGSVLVSSFQQLEREGRRLLNNDKLQLPYLRRRICT